MRTQNETVSGRGACKAVLAAGLMGVWVCLLLAGCGRGSNYKHENFKFVSKNGAQRGEEAFYKAVETCEKEKAKHSHKITGRDLGYQGGDAGFMGCMKLQGWIEKKEPEKS